ncbi:MAG: Dam family site-specific DNA-(adenine-N6)-methyltransferase [Eggerthellaceae bacterium]
MSAEEVLPAKPFLKWAGGKNWFIKYLPSFVNGLSIGTYYEPFLGGGSVYFYLHPEKSFLSDSNSELIETYIGIRDSADDVMAYLKQWPVNEEQYYYIREMETSEVAKKAARFIYLNRTSFNGIYRVNRAGKYNVPYGFRDGYQFDYDRIRQASSALTGAELANCDYWEIAKKVKKGDFVFLDPPYTVAHNKNGFIQYNKKLFSLEDQYLLREFIDEIASKQAYFILTNAAHETIRNIFSGCGLMLELPRFSGLGGKRAQRGSVSEFIFTNIPNVSLEEL